MAQFDPKTYDDVNSRIDKFWTENPDGAIVTDLLSDPNQIETTVFKASIWKNRSNISQKPDATGHAFENKGQTFKDGANFTHHLENCETSAIGRALADLNFKCKKESPRPSAQEMNKTSGGQTPAPAPRPVLQVSQTATKPSDNDRMTEAMREKIVDLAMKLKFPLAPEFPDYTVAQAKELNKKLMEMSK